LGTSAEGIGVRGVTNGGVTTIAVLGDNNSGRADGTGVAGLGGRGVGVLASGARAAILLRPNMGLTGAPTTGDHEMGELVVDRNGDLFFCKQTGTPGTWVRVA